MIHLITYSDDRMTHSAKVCVESALQNGVDNVINVNDTWISAEFKSFNADIFDNKRGAGCYWIFKPYFTYNKILLANDGDILIYSDAGIKWISNVNEIISQMDQDIFLFSNGHQHVHWCKMDIIKAINNIELADFGNASGNHNFPNLQQVQASVIFFKVNQNTRNFIKEWLLWCQMPGFIDDSPSKLPNHPEFAEHRHDQAILTCLQIKYGYKLHWWPDKLWYESQRYRWADDTYPSMFEHHRKRNKGAGENKNPEWE